MRTGTQNNVPYVCYHLLRIQLTETATTYVSNKTDGRLTVLEYLVLVSGTGSYNDLNVTTKFKILLLIKLQYKSAEQSQSFAAFLRK